MKSFVKFMLLFGVSTSLFFQVPCEVNAAGNSNGRWFDYNEPIQVLDNVVDNANKSSSDDVQNTKMDKVTSKLNSCGKDSRYTFSNTLCFITNNLHYYLQYVVYIGLALAVIFLIWNGLQLILSKDNEKQFEKFKTNAINIGIGVILIVAFYIIIDIFVSVVNLIAE